MRAAFVNGGWMLEQTLSRAWWKDEVVAWRPSDLVVRQAHHETGKQTLPRKNRVAGLLPQNACRFKGLPA